MAELALAAFVFLAMHILPAISARERVIAKIGDPVYMALFSLASILAFAWMVSAYDAAPSGEFLWITGTFWRAITALLMALAFVLIVAGVTTRNPSMVMSGSALKTTNPWAGI